MKNYAVAHIDWCDNDLRIEFIKASDWRLAILKHSKTFFNDTDYLVPDDIEVMKQQCFDSDGMMDVVEIPEDIR